MIYEHRTYYLSSSRQMPEFLKAFEPMVPSFEKHGAKFIGAWQNVIGQSNEYVYILGFEDLAQRERFWQSFYQDEQFLKYQQTPALVSYSVSKILKPTRFSPFR